MHHAQPNSAAESGARLSATGIPACWTKGGLSVTTLAREFDDPGWAPRGQYRAMLQFIMNWNNWPDPADRLAMLDGPPPHDMPTDQKARIAAVVHCLCERDGYEVPHWVHGTKARQRGGVSLIRDRNIATRFGRPTGFMRKVKDQTPKTAQKHKVWFEAECLNKR